MGEKLVSRGWIFALAAFCAGCGVSGPKQLEPSNFLAPPPPLPSAPEIRTDARRMPSDDHGGAITDLKTSVDPADSGGILVVPTLKPDLSKEVNGVSDTVRDNVRTPADVANARATEAGAPTTATSSRTTGPTQGEYMTLGAVVVTVNGNPIYANKVLSDITPVLKAKARELDADAFGTIAAQEAQQQIHVLEQTELEFAAAQRNLDKHDQALANQLTMQWKHQQITEAGGSLEQAKSRARADGRDFDDLTQEQYRVEMRRIFFQKKEFPKVQVSAADMRQFYAQHQDQMFTQRAEAKFSLIKINFEASGGRDQAMARIASLRERAIKGEDFAAIAGTKGNNDDDALLSSKGDAGFGDWIERGAFANVQVEQEVWKLKPGEITPVIEEPGAFFIAKMVERKDGKSRSFEDADVQALIRRALEAEQFNALRDTVIENLSKEAAIYPTPPDPPNFEPVVEMATQMYPTWTKR